jgi:starch phosphorylase
MALNKEFTKVAYFSMEMTLEEDIPTYAGGLGMLAGDLMRSCADMEIPAVGVTLVYSKGFYSQVFNPDGSQSFVEVKWHKSDQLRQMPEKVMIKIEGNDVHVGCWRYDIVGHSGFVVPVYLLDTNYFESDPWKRGITDNLYGGGGDTRLQQEMLLGIGGVQLLRQLGYRNIETYHMNEGHAAFVPLALMPEHNYQDDEIKKKCVFTTHTPVPAGHDSFDYDFAYKYASEYLPLHIRNIASHEKLHMSHLALNMSRYSFGVSKKHGAVARSMFPEHDIDSITNGVHHPFWVGSILQSLYNTYLPGWQENPDLLKEAVEKIPNDTMWEYHQQAKRRLMRYVNNHLTSVSSKEESAYPPSDQLFDENTLTITFARRAVPYKRPLLIYQDLYRLIRIGAGRIQLIHCGKSHPNDESSKQIVSEILKISKKLRGIVKIAYLEDYSPKLAKMLVYGSDVWLNNPRRPLEASGTSGMKAAMNGVLNFSVLDGWWIEGYEMCPKAGFPIGPKTDDVAPHNDDNADAEDLYKRLEHEVIPLYYDKREEWIQRMKHAVTLGAHFSTHRVIKEYLEKAWKKTEERGEI